MPIRSISIGTFFVVALVGVSGQAWAETVVLRASGPSAASYAPGQRMQDRAQIRLIEGDSLSLLSSGSTVQLRGPYDGPARVSEPAVLRPFNWLAMFKAPPRTRAAGSRGVATQTLASN